MGHKYIIPIGGLMNFWLNRRRQKDEQKKKDLIIYTLAGLIKKKSGSKTVKKKP